MSFTYDNPGFADKITDECFKLYDSLGKKGKPQANREWTNMACFVKMDDQNKDSPLEVITLATGTKCIGEKHRVSTGLLLNDSHAEVLARRLFLKYLYFQLRLSISNPSQSIFTHSACDNDIGVMLALKPGISFHLFSTETPCGDASIFPKEKPENIDNNGKKILHAEDREKSYPVISNSVNVGNNTEYVKYTKRKQISEGDRDCRLTKIRKFDATIDENKIEEFHKEHGNSKVNDNENYERDICSQRDSISINLKSDSDHSNPHDSSVDIHRTGAKCVAGGLQDLLQPGVLYHVTGALRIKPGRGFRTVSMSCSDKIMKWCCLGLQGGLLWNFIREPVLLSSITISSNTFDLNTMHRALSLRGRVSNNDQKNIPCHLVTNTPTLLQSSKTFRDSKENVEKNGGNMKITPAGASILWCSNCRIHELTSNGRKHGVTNKNAACESASTSVSKKKLLGDFLELVNFENFRKSLVFKDIENKPYHVLKRTNQNYKKRRDCFFELFSEWTVKRMSEELFTGEQ